MTRDTSIWSCMDSCVIIVSIVLSTLVPTRAYTKTHKLSLIIQKPSPTTHSCSVLFLASFTLAFKML